jgi:predicted ATPase/DNA-binding winged helix-turn-helix (wHTH) protein
MDTGGGESGLDRRFRAAAFGPFQLLPEQRRLLRDGRPVPLGSRALDLLLALVANAGSLLTKDELIAKVWPGTFIEEGALRVHVTALRKVLSDGRPDTHDLVNVPGRGYQFTAPVRFLEDDVSEVSSEPTASSTTVDIPAPPTPVFGRDADVGRIIDRMRLSPCLTIAGTGGVGKTTVALVVGRTVAARFGHGVAFVDLAPVTEAEHLVDRIGASLGVPHGEGTAIARLITFLSRKAVLLMLDNCEQVVAGVAEVVERLLPTSADLRILVTSREPLHVADECIYRLHPLASPAARSRPDARQVMTYPAVQLFVERATAVADHFVLDDTNAPVVAELCGRLDGLALAIEMAATRMDAFGIADIVAMLDDRFELLRRSRRGLADRQSSLSATLDWSFGMLPARQKAFLRDLSALSGRFTLEDAVTLTRTETVGRADAIGLLGDLVDKSFVTVDPTTTNATYRVSETMREYVRLRTPDTPEFAGGRRRHARFVSDVLARAERDAERQQPREWLAAHGRHLDDARSAIRWCLTDGNDIDLGVDVTARAVTLWTHLSLLVEMQRHVGAAIRATRCETTARAMRLHAALSYALVNLDGPTEEATRACQTALDIACRVGDRDTRARALLSLWDSSLRGGEIRRSLKFADDFASVAAELGPADVLVAHRLSGASRFYLGDASTGRKHTELMVAGYAMATDPGHVPRFGSGQLASARGQLATHHCFQGHFDRAMQGTRESAVEALRSGQAVTVCEVLGTSSIPNAIHTGYLEEARAFVDTLADNARTCGLRRWEVLATGYEGVLDLRTGLHDAGLEKLSRAVARCEDRVDTRFLHLVLEHALGLGRAGHPKLGRALVASVIERCEGLSQGWLLPELHRTRANLLELCGEAPGEIEADFCRALAAAERRGAVAWRLRAARDAAAYLCRQSRDLEAFEVVRDAYACFTEGFATPELDAARRLLEVLRPSRQAPDASERMARVGASRNPARP